ncbi:MAG: UDP-N-acetylmuramate--L-alanine ligase [Thermoleophilaceae bacterium]
MTGAAAVIYDSPFAGRALHFIGIGGAGMSGLALVTRALGAEVTGSDRAESAHFARLREVGVRPAVGHEPGAVPGGAEVVVSTAIDEGNPELVSARAQGAHVRHRGDVLAEVARLRRTIAVSGTHGKTTTASMTAHALLASGRSPSYLIGGELRSTGTNAAWGIGEWIVVEADESDRSFLAIVPEVAVVTNVELDHHGTYRGLGELEAAFTEWIAGAGRALVWKGLELGAAAETFGIDSGDMAAEGVTLLPGGSTFSVAGVDVRLRVPGRHNVLNALAALAACRAAGLPLEEAAGALESFLGAGRRFEPVGRTAAGAEVYDDYAHHPTEVRATLEAARTLSPERLVACFQPHLYSRTRRLAREFGAALALADLVMVLEVYPSREDAADHPGVSGWLVAAAAADAAGGRPVFFAPTRRDAGRILEEELRAGDLLLTLGAGDVDAVAREVVETLRADTATAPPR